MIRAIIGKEFIKILARLSRPAQKRMIAVLAEYDIADRALSKEEAHEASMMLVRITEEDLKARGDVKMDIPKNKTYPPDAGQCHNCGGHGCSVCYQNGWLPAGHPNIRKCEREGCGNPLAPSWVPVYCSGQCALMDA